MNPLTQVLKDQTEVFLNEKFTRLPFSLPQAASVWTQLLNWPVVEKAIESKKCRVRLVKDAKLVKESYVIGFNEARRLYNDGNSIWVKNAELTDSSLKKLADDFAKFFHTEVDVQLYCTPEGHNAFGWHFDVEEVFIVQVKGSKEYTIRHNTVHPNPLVSSISKDMGYDREKSELAIKVVLEAGDFLYIPSGWWHVANTKTESMHISIGLMPNSAVEIVSYLPKFLAQNPFWRTRMPVHADFKNEEAEIGFYQDAMLKLGKDLSQHLSSPEFIREFLKFKKKK